LHYENSIPMLLCDMNRTKSLTAQIISTVLKHNFCIFALFRILNTIGDDNR